MGITCRCFDPATIILPAPSKMKLVLVCCWVVVSCQYGYDPSWPYWQPAQYFHPLQYFHPARYYRPTPQQQQFRSGMQDYVQQLPMGRQFFNNLNIRILPTTTSTATVYVTSVTSATTLVDGGTCLLYAQVKDAAAALATCRKKRELAEFADLLAAASIADEQVAPSQVIRVEASALADLQSVAATPEVVSSQKDFIDDSFTIGENRAFLYITSITTVTSTVTSAVLSTSTTTKKLSANFADAAKATCIPPGFFIC